MKPLILTWSQLDKHSCHLHGKLCQALNSINKCNSRCLHRYINTFRSKFSLIKINRCNNISSINNNSNNTCQRQNLLIFHQILTMTPSHTILTLLKQKCTNDNSHSNQFTWSLKLILWWVILCSLILLWILQLHSKLNPCSSLGLLKDHRPILLEPCKT